MLSRKQANMWAQGDLFRAKLKEQQNGKDKVGVTRILSGVDDISINDNKTNDKPENHLVSDHLISLIHPKSYPPVLRYC